MGLRNGFIPTNDISVSSQNTIEDTLDTVRLGNSNLWVAALNDSSPWIEIRFSQSKSFSNKIFIYQKKSFF